MKKVFALAVALVTTMGASAQLYYQDATNVDMMRHSQRNEAHRREIVIPQVNGYTVYKADLHTHTIYSDGSVTPEYRVREAWMDGLDVMACTEHIEYRRQEGQFLQFLKGHVAEGTKASGNKDAKVDFNLANKLEKDAAVSYGITIIPGVEITRTPETIGHYNALFVKDANTIWDEDPEKAIRNAREQGAVIMHNHPGWRRKNLQMQEFEKKVYDADLIDGVEIMNGSEFYPTVVTRAQERGLFMAANTDIHGTTAMDYQGGGHMRNMTFILAKDQTLPSLKEALLARRTLAYSFGSIAGEEQLVKDFFMACVEFKVINKNSNGTTTMRLVNNSSIDYVLRFGGNPVPLNAFQSRHVTVAKDGSIKFTVENMWIPGEKQHPEIKLKF